MNNISIPEDENFSAQEGVFSDPNSANSNTNNERLEEGKKTVKKKTSKPITELAKVAVLKAAKEAIKKAASKKEGVKKVQALPAQGVAPKKAAKKQVSSIEASKDEKKQEEIAPTKTIKRASGLKQTTPHISEQVSARTPKTKKPVKADEQKMATDDLQETQQDAQPPAVDTADDLLASAASIASPTKTSVLRTITFQIKFKTVFGESLLVAANHLLVGNNDPEKAFLLNYLNENYWQGTIEIPATQPLSADIPYNYILKKTDGTYSIEWGCDKIIPAHAFDTEKLLLIDTWTPSSLIENTFYTEPFQEVLLKENFIAVEASAPDKITHVFRAKAPLLARGQVLCLIGSVPQLGEWMTEKPLFLSRKQGEVWHSIPLDLSESAFPFNYKYGLFDTNTNAFIAFENGPNRVMYNGVTEALTVVSDGFADVPNTGFKGAGVAIPVFSLRSARSFGVGEFTDLKLMVDWAKKVGLK
ncbi:MAG: 4-alpha-glucanotransferase, partial [Bacteroidota bacterium]|nr:4-alpha-glucanotransferase [Bacteroidota bacterium]